MTKLTEYMGYLTKKDAEEVIYLLMKKDLVKPKVEGKIVKIVLELIEYKKEIKGHRDVAITYFTK